MSSTPPPSRYETLVKIASGGMGTVFVGRARGALGFQQLVAIKRPHPHLLENEAFRKMLTTEAQLSSRIRHANVVAVRDAEIEDDSVLLVMDYIEGGSLADLPTDDERAPDRRAIAPVLLRIVLDVCAGLHAAHELRDEDDAPLGLVHRDISPHNVLVGLDGVARVTDFGIAKSMASTTDATTDGVVKGKLAYMSPEQLQGHAVDRRSDVFSAGIVLWEALTGQRLFRSANPAETMTRLLGGDVARISAVTPAFGSVFDDVVARALAVTPAERHPSAAELADRLEEVATGAGLLASHQAVARFVGASLGDALALRRERIRALRGGPAATSGRATLEPASDGTGSISLTTEVRTAPTPPTPTAPPTPPEITRTRPMTAPAGAVEARGTGEAAQSTSIPSAFAPPEPHVVHRPVPRRSAGARTALAVIAVVIAASGLTAVVLRRALAGRELPPNAAVPAAPAPETATATATPMAASAPAAPLPAPSESPVASPTPPNETRPSPRPKARRLLPPPGADPTVATPIVTVVPLATAAPTQPALKSGAPPNPYRDAGAPP